MISPSGVKQTWLLMSARVSLLRVRPAAVPTITSRGCSSLTTTSTSTDAAWTRRRGFDALNISFYPRI